MRVRWTGWTAGELDLAPECLSPKVHLLAPAEFHVAHDGAESYPDAQAEQQQNQQQVLPQEALQSPHPGSLQEHRKVRL